jgi:hypothetical protein
VDWLCGRQVDRNCMLVNCSVVIVDTISLIENQRNSIGEYDNGVVKRFGRVTPGFIKEIGSILPKAIQRSRVVDGIIQSSLTALLF